MRYFHVAYLMTTYGEMTQHTRNTSPVRFLATFEFKYMQGMSIGWTKDYTLRNEFCALSSDDMDVANTGQVKITHTKRMRDPLEQHEKHA